jgi:hypothetical protein
MGFSERRPFFCFSLMRSKISHPVNSLAEARVLTDQDAVTDALGDHRRGGHDYLVDAPCPERLNFFSWQP